MIYYRAGLFSDSSAFVTDYCPHKRFRSSKDVTEEIMGHWFPNSITLPPIDDLARFLSSPLHERAKVLLNQRQFDSLISSPMELTNRSTKNDIERLFRVNDKEFSEGLNVLFYKAAVDRPPNDDSTENAFISFWDKNVRDVLEALLPGGTAIRNSNHHTSTLANRPDFGFIYNQICPFRGEEKSPTNTDDPKAELSQKLTWVYDPAPYILGKITVSRICFLTQWSSI
jgi:hypothetical protein